MLISETVGLTFCSCSTSQTNRRKPIDFKSIPWPVKEIAKPCKRIFFAKKFAMTIICCLQKILSLCMSSLEKEIKKNLLSQSTVRNWSSIAKLNRELGSQGCNHRLNFFGELLKQPWCSWVSIKIKLIFSWIASTILLLRLCDGIRSWDLYRFTRFIALFSFLHQ